MKRRKLFIQFALAVAFVFAFTALRWPEGVLSVADVQRNTPFIRTHVAAYFLYFSRPFLPFRKSVLPDQKIPLISDSETTLSVNP